MRVVSANLNGIRSASQKGFFDWLSLLGADVVCVQELKAQEADLSPALTHPGNQSGVFHFAQKKGYSGVGLYSPHTMENVRVGFGVSEFDDEGRYVQAELSFLGKPLTVISLYAPSGSSSEERQAAKFRFMEVFPAHLRKVIAESQIKGGEVLICGDINIAHQEIDLKNWKGNLKNSGFLPEERQWLSQLFNELGLIDVYRHLYPNTTDECYTWWSNRGQAYAKNVGWRIDYQIATPSLAAHAKNAFVYKDQKFSDHAPLIVEYG